MSDTTSIDVLVQRYTGKLLKMITVKTTPTKLLNIEVITFDEKLSLNLVSNIISKLEELLLSFKNSELVEKKKIITSRLSILEKDLIKKEDQLKTFRENNRQITFSPALLLKQERFLREIEVQKQIYINLKTELEMIQVNENNSAAMLQILDPPEYFGNVAMSAILIIFLYLLAGIIISCSLVILVDWWNKSVKL